MADISQNPTRSDWQSFRRDREGGLRVSLFGVAFVGTAFERLFTETASINNCLVSDRKRP